MFVLGSKQKLIVYQREIPHGSGYQFAETDKLISSFRVEKPAWTKNCIAIAATSLGWVSIRAYPNMPWLLTHHDIDGNVLGEFPFPELEIEGDLTLPLLAAHHDHVFIGLGKTLLVHNRREFTHTILGERIHRLTTSSPFATPVCLISLELGASLYWPRTERLVHVDEDLATPAIGFSVAGHVVAIDGETMIVCRTAQESIRYLTKQSWSKARPISVVAGPSPNDFGVVTVEYDFVQFRVS